MAKNYNLDLPVLPAMQARSHEAISENQLSRRKLQGLLHIMTAELKARGTKTPHIFLPFRSRVDDTKLTLFLRRVFPGGMMIDTSLKAIVRTVLSDFDEFTLVCGLKYLWCRLPNNEVIGWSVYLEFKRKEHEAGYPKDAFLTIMPKCLLSSSHASIVYDFLDLMISIASNSQYNHLNGRKIAKMASIWAFKSVSQPTSAFYDATIVQEASFLDGLESWKQTCNGLFHLLLSFLRAMLPDTETETLNLPKTLQSLLITNSYPPPDNSNSMKSVITIPCVHVRSTRKSENPYELISKVRHSLSFEKKDFFLSIENFTILKNIFQKSSTAEIVSTLSEESRRILSRLTADPVPSEFNLYPGWAHESTDSHDPDIPMYSEIKITSVTLQDYFIWTWLSSLGSDQTSSLKSRFGRSIVVEAGLRGFQKWMVLSETTMQPDEYISIFKNQKPSISIEQSRRSPDKSSVLNLSKDDSFHPKLNLKAAAIKTELPLPPPPVPLKELSSLTPPHDSTSDVSFSNDNFSLEDQIFTSLSQREAQSPSPDFNHELSQSFSDKLIFPPKKGTQRPRPPPLELPQKESVVLRSKAKLPHLKTKPKLSSKLDSHKSLVDNSKSFQSPRSMQRSSNDGYNEPYENYGTAFDRPKVAISLEPFDNYQVPCESQNSEIYPITSNQGVKHSSSLPLDESRVHNREPLPDPREKKLPPIRSNHDHMKFLPERNENQFCEAMTNTEKQPVEYNEALCGNNQTEAEFEGSLQPVYGSQYDNGHSLSRENGHAPDRPYPDENITEPLFSCQSSKKMNHLPQTPGPGFYPAQSTETENNLIEHTEKKKRKNKNQKEKSLGVMMKNLPEGPPPPLSEAHFKSSNAFEYEAEQRNRAFPDDEERGHDPSPNDFLRPFCTPDPERTAKQSSRKLPREDYTFENSVQEPKHSENTSFSDLCSEDFQCNKNNAPSSSKFEGSAEPLDQKHFPHVESNTAIADLSKNLSPRMESVGHRDQNQLNPYMEYQPGISHLQPQMNLSPENWTPQREQTLPSPLPVANQPRYDSGAISHESQLGISNAHNPEQAHSPMKVRQHLMILPGSAISLQGQNPAILEQQMTMQTAQSIPYTDTSFSQVPASAENTRVEQPMHVSPNNVQPFNAPPPMNGQFTQGRSVNGELSNAKYMTGQNMHENNSHGPSMGMQPGNGPPMKGIPTNRHPVFGQSINGHPMHGPLAHGLHMSGQPINGHHVQGQHMPQYRYQPPPPGQHKLQPSGQHILPPQGYGYTQQSMMYPPLQRLPYNTQNIHQNVLATQTRPSTSELTMMNMPNAHAFKKNSKPNKADLRAALNQGTFGI